MPDEITLESAKEPRPGAVTDALARQLTAGVARGDEAAFQALYDSYHHRLAAFLAVATRGDELLASETLQSTFLMAARKMKRLESEAHLWNWLARVARQHLAKAWRARGLDETPTGAPMLAELAPEPAPDALLEESLNSAILTLDPEDRQAVEWHYFENLSHKEIAERLGATPKAVSSRLERARARLRSIVNKLLSHDT